MIGYIKQVLVILAAGLSGYVVGVYSVVTRVPRTPSLIVGESQSWMPAVEGAYLAAAVGVSACVLGWMYVDYKYVVKE